MPQLQHLEGNAYNFQFGKSCYKTETSF